MSEQVYVWLSVSGTTFTLLGWLVGWMFGFNGISIFVGYLTPNPFFMKMDLFQTIQFSIST